MLGKNYTYLLCVLIYILQIIALFSNLWYGTSTQTWGLYNQCSNGSCSPVYMTKTDKVVLYVCRALVMLSAVITLVIIGFIYYKPERTDLIKKMFIGSTVSMGLALVLSLRFRKYGKISGSIQSGFAVCLTATLLNGLMVYLFAQNLAI